MEVLRAEGLGAESRHPGWLPPSLSALLPSNGSSESGAPGELSPSPRSSSRESRDSGCFSFEERCLINLAKAYCKAPPPPAPAREMPQMKKKVMFYSLIQKMFLSSPRNLQGVHWSTSTKGRRSSSSSWMSCLSTVCLSQAIFTHTLTLLPGHQRRVHKNNFFFAELQLCSKKRSPSRFLVTCCEPLGPHCTVGHKGFQVDGSVARKNVDFTRCFACSPMVFHPQGEKYIAGHCNIPYMYDSPY